MNTRNNKKTNFGPSFYVLYPLRLRNTEFKSNCMYVPTGEPSVATVAFGNEDVSVAVNAPDVVKLVTAELID